MQIGNVVLGNTSVGWIIALIVFVLAIVALFGGIAITPHFVMVEVAGCAMSRLL
jgi:hypothetical protein